MVLITSHGTPDLVNEDDGIWDRYKKSTRVVGLCLFPKVGSIDENALKRYKERCRSESSPKLLHNPSIQQAVLDQRDKAYSSSQLRYHDKCL